MEEVDNPIRAQSPSPSKEKTVGKSCHETVHVWQMTKRDFGEYENDEKKITLWGANIMEPRLLATFASLIQMSTLDACPFLSLR